MPDPNALRATAEALGIEDRVAGALRQLQSDAFWSTSRMFAS
jgi:hypothetical protein